MSDIFPVRYPHLIQEGLSQTVSAPDEILIIEDNEDDAILMRWKLRRDGLGPAIHLITDADEAKEYLTNLRPDGVPRILVIAISMRGEAGYELLEWVRQQPDFHRCILVAVGNSDRESDVQKAYDLGANAYYLKGIDFTQFAQVIRDLQFV